MWIVIWRIRKQMITNLISDCLWSRLRSHWLAWAVTSFGYTRLWSRRPRSLLMFSYNHKFLIQRSYRLGKTGKREFEWSEKGQGKIFFFGKVGGKIKKLCATTSDFQAKMHQIWFPLGLCPRPHWGSLYCSPRRPSLILLHKWHVS